LLNSATSLLLPYWSGKFWFYGKTLTGAIKQRPREDRALQTANGIEEKLCKLCRKKFCWSQRKAEMIQNIIWLTKIVFLI
jgi:endothelin-converting enzyme/putative endopeptidase